MVGSSRLSKCGLLPLALTCLMGHAGSLAHARDPEAGGDNRPRSGLRLTISCADEYVVYEPIYVLAKLENTSEGAKEVPDLGGGWAGSSTMDFEIKGPRTSKNYPYRCPADTGRRSFVGGTPRTIALARAGVTTGEFNITKYSMTVEPGRYSIVGTYRYYTPEGELVAVRSNAAKFSLVSPGVEDLQALVALAHKGKLAGINMIMDSANDYYYLTMGFEEKYLYIVREFRGSAFPKYLAFYLGRYYCAKGEHAQAIRLLEPVTGEKSFALTDDALVLLAKCYRSAGRKADADSALGRVFDEYAMGNCVRQARMLLREEVREKEAVTGNRKGAEHSELDEEGNVPPEQQRTAAGKPDRTEEGPPRTERDEPPLRQTAEE